MWEIFFSDCQVIAKLKWGHFSFGKYEDSPVKGVEYVHITILKDINHTTKCLKQNRTLLSCT